MPHEQIGLPFDPDERPIHFPSPELDFPPSLFLSQMTSIEALYDALTRAINPNPAIMRAGEENLQAILKEVGVLRKLQTIAVTQSLDLNTRQVIFYGYVDEGLDGF